MAQSRQSTTSSKTAKASTVKAEKSEKPEKSEKHERPSSAKLEKAEKVKSEKLESKAEKVDKVIERASTKIAVASPVKKKEERESKPAPADVKRESKSKIAAAPPAVAAVPVEAPKPLRPPTKPVVFDDVETPSPQMDKEELERFRVLLLEKRDDIVKKAKETLNEDMALDVSDLPDEMDLASSEYLQSFTFRLRGREKVFLDKINKALQRIDDGTFGICEECGEGIGSKRLEARPETTLCIRCKEDQERAEKDFG